VLTQALSPTEKYQLEIVKADGLTPLLRLLHSSYLPLILSAAACVRNVSFDENEEVQCHAISTLRNLAASSERNKTAIVEAGAVERIKQLVLQAPLLVQSEMTACVAVLALSGKLCCFWVETSLAEPARFT
jgi:vacuolar protein 8